MSSLLLSSGAYDRSAIMTMAHERYRAPGNARSYQDCLRWVWAVAQRERQLLAAGHDDELRRLRVMRAHHLARLGVRPRIVEARAA